MSFRFRFLLPVIATIALATTATPALAQNVNSEAAGHALFADGAALFNRGDFAAACPKFEASLRAYPGLGTRGKLAECYERLGRYASAWAAYREVAQLAKQAGDVTREQVARARADSLEPKLPRLTITLPPANDFPGLVIKRGGTEVDRAKLGVPEPVDSGEILIEVSAPGRKTFTTQLTAALAQPTSFDVPSLASTESPAVDLPGARGDAPAWEKPVGLVLGGVGIVGMGVGGVLGLAAKSKYDGAFRGGGCDRATKSCDGPGQNQVDDARSKATLSTLFVAAGAAFAVGGAVLFLSAPSSRPMALQVAPTTYAGGAGLSVSGAL